MPSAATISPASATARAHFGVVSICVSIRAGGTGVVTDAIPVLIYKVSTASGSSETAAVVTDAVTIRVYISAGSTGIITDTVPVRIYKVGALSGTSCKGTGGPDRQKQYGRKNTR